MNSAFISQITEGMKIFGMQSGAAFPENGIYRLFFTDSANSISYVALAQESPSSEPEEYWRAIFAKQFRDMISGNMKQGETPPAVIITPVIEAVAVINEAGRYGASPVLYQLFEKYAVIGFTSLDTGAIVDAAPPQLHRDPEEMLPTGENADSPDKMIMELKSKIPDFTPKKGFPYKKVGAVLLILLAIAGAFYAGTRKNTHKIAAAPVAGDVVAAAISGKPADKAILTAQAGNPNMPPAEVEALLDKGYIQAAANPSLPVSRHQELVYSLNPAKRIAVAKNSGLSADYMAVLAMDKNENVRAALAANPSLPDELMQQLLADDNRAVRSALLANPNVTDDMLAAIYPDRSTANCVDIENIYAGALVSVEELIAASGSRDVCARRGAARNPNTPVENLKALMNDEDETARHFALANSALLPEQSVINGNWTEKISTAELGDIGAALTNPSASEKTLDIAALNPGRYGEYVAANPSATPAQQRMIGSYAAPKGGLQQFFSGLEELPADDTLVNRLNAEREAYPGTGSWQSTLRKNINEQFTNEVYDPLITDKFEQRASGNLPSLAVLPDGGEFFGAIPESFQEQLGAEPSEAARGMAQAADDIVDEIMREMTPAVEEAMDDALQRRIDDARNMRNGTYTPRANLSNELYEESKVKLEDLAETMQGE